MTLSYPSDTTLRLHFPVKFWAYVTFVFMAFMGAFFAFAMWHSEPFPFYHIPVAIALLFLVVGVWGVFNNSSATLTLDAQTRRATLRNRSLWRTTERTLPFNDIRSVRSIGDDEFNTVGLVLRDGAEIPLEDVQVSRKDAAAVAETVADWLRSQGAEIEPMGELVTT